MSLYSNAYAIVLRENVMLLIIAIALLLFTFSFWVGIPIFVIGNMLTELNTPIFMQGVCISIFVGLFFSLFFIPINLKVAKMVGEMKYVSITQAFSRLHLVFVLISAIVFYFVISIILWTTGDFLF